MLRVLKDSSLKSISCQEHIQHLEQKHWLKIKKVPTVNQYYFGFLRGRESQDTRVWKKKGEGDQNAEHTFSSLFWACLDLPSILEAKTSSHSCFLSLSFRRIQNTTNPNSRQHCKHQLSYPVPGPSRQFNLSQSSISPAPINEHKKLKIKTPLNHDAPHVSFPTTFTN